MQYDITRPRSQWPRDVLKQGPKHYQQKGSRTTSPGKVGQHQDKRWINSGKGTDWDWAENAGQRERASQVRFRIMSNKDMAGAWYLQGEYRSA